MRRQQQVESEASGVGSSSSGVVDAASISQPASAAPRKRGPKPGTLAARRGGETVKQRYGVEFYSRIGAKGGASVRNQHGLEFYAEIGRKGGSKTRERKGLQFYAEIGRKGGSNARGIPKRRKRNTSDE